MTESLLVSFEVSKVSQKTSFDVETSEKVLKQVTNEPRLSKKEEEKQYLTTMTN